MSDKQGRLVGEVEGGVRREFTEVPTCKSNYILMDESQNCGVKEAR